MCRFINYFFYTCLHLNVNFSCSVIDCQAKQNCIILVFFRIEIKTFNKIIQHILSQYLSFNRLNIIGILIIKKNYQVYIHIFNWLIILTKKFIQFAFDKCYDFEE